MHVIAAKAVCFKEALSEEFRAYQLQIKKNASALCDELMKLGIALFKDSICRCFADIDNAYEIMDNFRKRVEIIKYGAWKQS